MSYYYDEYEHYEPDPIYYEEEPIYYETEPISYPLEHISYEPEPTYEFQPTYDEPGMAYDEPEMAYDKPEMAYYEPETAHNGLETAYDEREMAYDERGMAYDEREMAYNEPELEAVCYHTEPTSEIHYDPDPYWDNLEPVPVPRYEDIHPMYLNWVWTTAEVQSTSNNVDLDGTALESQQDNLEDSYHDPGGDDIEAPAILRYEDLHPTYRHANDRLPTSGVQPTLETIHLLLRSQANQRCSDRHSHPSSHIRSAFSKPARTHPPRLAISSASNSRTRHHHAQDRPTQQHHPPLDKPPPAHIIPLATPQKRHFTNPQTRPHRKHPPMSLPAATTTLPNHQANAARRISQKVTRSLR
ncbi:hypothetical protein BDZ97DRAFT_1760044 [Flammula alnicola]|nr:hypothetical protein BDZ97DRAFT_1760044 [Flammula alnicola]